MGCGCNQGNPPPPPRVAPPPPRQTKVKML